MSKRVRRVVAVLLAATMVFTMVLATGCKPATTPTKKEEGTAEKKTGGVMSFYIAEPAYIDPYNGQESEGVQVIQALYDGLVDFDYKTSEIKPAVAESWEPNADGSEWTFHLKPGTKFSDGTPVTAASFKYAWERIANPANKSDISYHLSSIKGTDDGGFAPNGISGVVAKDDNTLVVTLKQSFSDFPYVTGHPSLGPVPQAAVEKDAKAFLEMPVGNGPFKMAEPWKHEQEIKLVRNDNYYGDKPLLDGVDFKIFKDEETAYNEFQAGNMDFVAIPSGQIKATKDKYGVSTDGYTVEPGKQTLNGAELSTYYIWMDTKDPVLKNKDLRIAISSAINRQAICDTVYEGTREPATGPVPKGIVGHQDNAWPENAYDVERAKQFLAKAGFPDGKGLPTLRLSFNTGAGHEDVMTLVQADLKKIGINTKFDGHEFSEYVSTYLKIENKQYVSKQPHQLMRLGWLADYPIMDNFIYPLFFSSSTNNQALYDNPAVDKAILDARATTDEAARITKYQDVEKLIGQDMPMIALVNYQHKRVGSDRLRDFVFSPMGLGDFGHAWLETEK